MTRLFLTISVDTYTLRMWHKTVYGEVGVEKQRTNFLILSKRILIKMISYSAMGFKGGFCAHVIFTPKILCWTKFL